MSANWEAEIAQKLESLRQLISNDASLFIKEISNQNYYPTIHAYNASSTPVASFDSNVFMSPSKDVAEIVMTSISNQSITYSLSINENDDLSWSSESGKDFMDCAHDFLNRAKDYASRM